MESLQEQYLDVLKEFRKTPVLSIARAEQIKKHLQRLNSIFAAGNWTGAESGDLIKLRNEAWTKARDALEKAQLADIEAQMKAVRAGRARQGEVSGKHSAPRTNSSSPGISRTQAPRRGRRPDRGLGL